MLDVMAFRAVLREEIDAAIERALTKRFGASRCSKKRLAAALDKTTATVDRYVREGMPCEHEGKRRAFDLDACRAWLQSRSPQSTKGPLEQGVERRTRSRG